jgi:TfoX/Sxy family transcriptional regulator of competence genes
MMMAMATDPKTVSFLVDQMSAAGAVSARQMFGDWGLYCDGKMVALTSDGQLFVKPTAGGRTFAVGSEEAPPYQGAKPCLLIDPEHWDDAKWLSELIRISTAELPMRKPKPKAKSAKKA